MTTPTPQDAAREAAKELMALYAERPANPIYFHLHRWNETELAAIIQRHYDSATAELRRERDELADKLTAQVLFSAVGGRLITKVFEAADMSLPDASDAELSLVRIISERNTLRTEVESLRAALADRDRQIAVLKQQSMEQDITASNLRTEVERLQDVCVNGAGAACLTSLRARLTLAEGLLKRASVLVVQFGSSIEQEPQAEAFAAEVDAALAAWRKENPTP